MPPSLMASTRRPPTGDVYQDASFAPSREEDVEAALLHALAPLSDASSQPKVHLDPPTDAASGASPTKTHSSPMRPVSSHSLSDIKIPPPTQPVFVTDSPRKNGSFYTMYYPPHPMPAYFTGQQVHTYEQENYYASNPFHGIPIVPHGEVDSGYKGPMKRALMDPTPTRDKSKKPRMDQEEPFDLPDPKDMPSVHDDGAKPSYSYAELIGMAILRSPNRRLTLAQIYKWISDHFSFYKASESGWQNSIRHNLSLNKNFIKQERPKDDPGKGNYWAIKPGEERPFLLGKKNPIRRITNPDGTQYISGLPHEMSYPSSGTPAIGHFTLAPNPVKKSEAKAIDSAKFPDDADLLSDGTIPASDAALDDDEKDDAVIMMPPPANLRSSPPPPVDLGSSPPQMASQTRKDTPPPVPRFPSTSRSGNRRQKFGGMNDSGYWSSIESSVARGPSHLLTSEADISRPRLRKGRAETEIARIRSSSVGSPGNELHHMKPSTSHFDSSSPLRDEHPLTPAVVFKRPAKPPPSVSPNTNLRNHRNRMRALLGTPAKSFSPAPLANNWSPAFNIGEDGSVGLTPYVSPYQPSKTPWKAFQDTPGGSTAKKSLFNATFDIFIDAPEDDPVLRGSPEKRPVRRPSLARAATSAGILADVTGSARSNTITLAPPQLQGDSPFSISPFLKQAGGLLRSPAKLGSPLKQSYCPPSNHTTPDEHKWLNIGLGGEENVLPSQLPADEALFGAVHLPSDGSEEAIDIFQDFGKIGGVTAAASMLPVPSRANGSPVRRSAAPPPSSRPGLARSNTSRW